MSDVPGLVPSATAAARMARIDSPRPQGVWRDAWRRYRADRVGVAALAVVLAYAVLIVLAATGLVARDWQTEVGVPDAPPTFAPRTASAAEAGGLELAGIAPAASAPEVDISDVDPLAPRYKEWN